VVEVGSTVLEDSSSIELPVRSINGNRDGSTLNSRFKGSTITISNINV
jgi:hypothetical protein